MYNICNILRTGRWIQLYTMFYAYQSLGNLLLQRNRRSRQDFKVPHLSALLAVTGILGLSYEHAHKTTNCPYQFIVLTYFS